MTIEGGEVAGGGSIAGRGEVRSGTEPAATGLPVRLAVMLGLVASLSVPLAVLVTGTSGTATLVGPAIYVAAAALLLRAVQGRALGVANGVTLVRLVLVTWIAALVPALASAAAASVATGETSSAAAGAAAAGSASAAVGSSPVALVAVLLTGAGTLLLDGVDGRVARRRGEATALGARFDSETDAALVLVLSVAVLVVGAAGWWVLAIGLMRYAQLGAAAVVPRLRAPVPPSLARKVVGVAQVVVLLVVLGAPSVVPAVVTAAVLVAALGALTWSFGCDAYRQLANRPDLASGPDVPMVLTAVADPQPAPT